MAKKKRPAQPARSRIISMPPRLIEALEEVDDLTRRKRWDEALDVLEELDERYPNHPAVLTQLANVSQELNDMTLFEDACACLVKADPDNDDAALALAGAYLQNARPVLGLRAFQRFVQRWPEHPQAPEVRQMIQKLEEGLAELLKPYGLSPNEASLTLAEQHEEVQFHLAHGNYAQVKRVAQEVLRRQPDFAPVRNNLSLCCFMEGELEQAAAEAQRVLDFQSDNIHALSNLVRFQFILGRTEEARQTAERLRNSQTQAADLWLKKMEAFAVLGDDVTVLECFRQAEQTGDLALPTADPFIFHLAAASEAQLGQEKEARQYWKRALEVSPHFQLAADNLADLRQPIGQRHGAWAYSLPYWINEKSQRDLVTVTQQASRSKKETALEQALRRYLQQHPEVIKLAPVLLQRSDPAAAMFVLGLAGISTDPELLVALKSFALGQRGSDELRHQAAQLVVVKGGLPAGPITLWIKGQPAETLLLNFEIHTEPSGGQHSRVVERLLLDSIEAGRINDFKRAETALRQALELEPQSPDLANNLAAVYKAQGKHAEAATLARQNYERHPDYLFSRVQMASLLTEAGQLDEAQQLLDPLLTRTRLHVSEFLALCGGQIELQLARGQKDVARSWFDMMEAAEPDHPSTQHYRTKFYKPNIRDLLHGGWGRPDR
jgi:tetratricopeptide (TPR) repeat protein